MRIPFLSLTASILLLGEPVIADAQTVADPTGDYLATFTGAANADLDLVNATVGFDGSNFTLGSTSAGAIGGSANSLFVWGINRGAGTARLAAGTPSVGPGVLFDAAAVFFPNGTGRVVAFGASGPPVITPLFSAVTVAGNTITGVVPLSLLPSRGFAPGNYSFTLWSRLRVNPAADGSNAEIADFAPNAGGLTAVPEPASWALILGGFAMTGGAIRAGRRRRAAVA